MLSQVLHCFQQLPVAESRTAGKELGAEGLLSSQEVAWQYGGDTTTRCTSCLLGRLWSSQGLPSTMPHGMAERPHGVDFSLLAGAVPVVYNQCAIVGCCCAMSWSVWCCTD